MYDPYGGRKNGVGIAPQAFHHASALRSSWLTRLLVGDGAEVRVVVGVVAETTALLDRLRATSGYLSTLTPVQKNVPLASSLVSAPIWWRQA